MPNKDPIGKEIDGSEQVRLSLGKFDVGAVVSGCQYH
jgi:hypothetical protein